MNPFPLLPPLSAMPWKPSIPPLGPCLPSVGKRAACLLAPLVLLLPGFTAAAQQAAATPKAKPSAPAASASPSPSVLEVPKPGPLNLPPIPAKFVHPGLLNSMEELQFIKKKIAAGEEPWKTTFEQMKGTTYASLTYTPHPHLTTTAGILARGGLEGGFYDLDDDTVAAYTQALMWIFTDNEQYAQNAVNILNAWNIFNGEQGIIWYLGSSWHSSIWCESAELIRSTYPKWSPGDIAKFSAMLDRAFMPVLHNQMGYGNRELSVCNGLMAIGVFNNDRAAFAEGLSHWVSYVPCWIYLKTDGTAPRTANYWLSSPSDDELAKMDEGLFPDVKKSWIYSDQTTFTYDIKKKMGNDNGMARKPTLDLWNGAPPEAFVDGLCAETFRDLGHCDLGYSQLINVAEIAWHQGIDLYGLEAKRITAFMEFENWLRTADTIPEQYYRVIPSGLGFTFEIGYNHYHNCMGMDLPNTKKLIELSRPYYKEQPLVLSGGCYMRLKPGIRASTMSGPAGLDVCWEALTHAELNAKGNMPAASVAAQGTNVEH